MAWEIKGKTEFNGETYVFLGKYYRRFKRGNGVDYLHRKVWEYHNGDIPDGFHIHHKDENTLNNSIENLELISEEMHIKEHIETRRRIGREHVDSGHLERVREMTKEWHASEDGRKWHSDHAKETFNRDNYEKVTKKCENCGKEYEKPEIDANHSKFCSNNCKSAARRKSGVDNVKRVCVICNKEFDVNKYSKKILCSRKCSGLYRRKSRKSV